MQKWRSCNRSLIVDLMHNALNCGYSHKGVLCTWCILNFQSVFKVYLNKLYSKRDQMYGISLQQQADSTCSLIRWQGLQINKMTFHFDLAWLGQEKMYLTSKHTTYENLTLETRSSFAFHCLSWSLFVFILWAIVWPNGVYRSCLFRWSMSHQGDKNRTFAYLSLNKYITLQIHV